MSVSIEDSCYCVFKSENKYACCKNSSSVMFSMSCYLLVCVTVISVGCDLYLFEDGFL